MTDDLPYADGEPFTAAKLNSTHRGHQHQGVLSGGEATPGSGDWDVDVASVEYALNGIQSASSGTLTHDPTPDDRLDLITVDEAGTVSITKGPEASASGQPNAPDIPADEVLLAVVYIRDGAAEILAGDLDNSAKTLIGQGEGSGLDADTIRGSTTSDLAGNQLEESDGALNVQEGEDSGLDADTLRGRTDSSLTSPIFGDGSDGEIIRSANGSENGIINATRYVLEDGATRTVTNGVLVIHATEEIVINGTIDADGAGGAGGGGGFAPAGSTSNGNSGNDGIPAEYVEGDPSGGGSGGSPTEGDGTNGGAASGGGGGAGNNSGGDGGSSGQRSWDEEDALIIPHSGAYRDVYRLATFGGAGAGGGGAGGGSFGGSNDPGDGGDGGDGGGVVLLIAPKIKGSGSLTADGESGQDGGDSSGNTTGSDHFVGEGGGGGGGNGGLIALFSGVDAYSGVTSVTGGIGGNSGSGDRSGGNGGQGGNGADGLVVRVGA